MSQPPAPATMSQTPATTLSSSNIEGIFAAALKSYEKKTKRDLKKLDLFKQLEKCDSPAAILAIFQADQFDPSRTGSDDRLRKWLIPAANVLYAFSGTLGAGVGLVFSPANVVFSGVGVLLLAAKGVAASQDILVYIFARIKDFFGRLETYAGIPPTKAMTDKMVEITVEVLDILAIATKEMKQSRAKRFVKRIAGRTDLEDGLKKLDTLTNEEVVMASAQLLKITHSIDNKMTGIGDGVSGVDEKVEVVIDNVKAVEDMIQTIAGDSKEVKATVDDVKWNQVREILRKWQSPPDPSTNHNTASDRQHEGTAKWFIEDDKFKDWKVTGSLLWIHGKPGSGKSVLCSAIINDVTTLCEAGSVSMAYFYFDFQDINKKTRRSLLSSLLIQLSSRSNNFCDIFSRLHKAHDNGGHQPSDSALTQCLKEMLALPYQRPVYLIIDALDECPDTSDFPSAREQVLNLVKDLISLRLPSLHICVTSRPEVDISDALESLASHTIALQDEHGQKKDIADYVQSVVYSGSGKFMRRWKQEDKEHVIKALSENAGGMFRWVFCQLEMLQNCLPQNVQHVLRELPKSLDETYERMLKGIGNANRHQAHRLLQCLTVATRPLRVEELAEVLALDFDGAKDGIPALNKDWRWDDQQEGVLSTCSSLIVIVDDSSLNTRVVQFAHFSVKEFLTSDRLANLKADISHFHISLEPAHAIMARACLGILLHSDNSSVDNDKVKGISPLVRYAAQYWVVHAQFETVSLRVEGGIRHLFDSAKPYFAAWRKSYDIDEEWTSFLGVDVDEDADSPSMRSLIEFYAPLREGYDASLRLYYASFCGFRDLTKHLIAKNPRHLNVEVGLNKSPLVAALRNRHIQVAELLHQHGAVLDVMGHHCRTLLHAASMDGLTDVAQWLLNTGADASAQEDSHTTPLHLAAENGHLELVRTLLGHSADANAADWANRTPLHNASASGHADIVRLLIRHGSDVNAQDSWSRGTSLHMASSSGNTETVQLLIEHGADVNVRDKRHSTPLHMASSGGNAQIVQLLIGHGADINARDQSHSTPLLLASSRGATGTVQLLIQHGAYVNAKGGGSHSTPLHLASFAGNAETVQLLIEHGADVNAQDQSHSTPLHLASFHADVEAVRLLIEHGADVNSQDGSKLTPLHLTSSWRSTDISHILMSWAPIGSTPLPPEASREERAVDIVRLLLEHGANVGVQDDQGQTLFQSASSRGHHKIAQWLSDYLASLE